MNQLIYPVLHQVLIRTLESKSQLQVGGIAPYQFEPYTESDRENDTDSDSRLTDEDSDHEDRLLHTNWWDI